MGLFAPIVAHAGGPSEFVGLFIQGCLPFSGDASALRNWAQQMSLHPLPEQARAAFLHGAPGQVFDGSTADAKLVLVSSDDGLCSVVTNQATQSAVVNALESGFRQAGLAFRLVIERDDKQVHAIHDREYLAAKNQRGWRVLAATVDGENGGQAMLTAAPE